MNARVWIWFVVCILPFSAFGTESNVFSFASHQNTCCHQTQFANNNPCCLLHERIKGIGCMMAQNYGIRPQIQMQINAVYVQSKLGFGLNVLHKQFNQLKQTQIAFGLAFVCTPQVQIGIQIKGLRNTWLNQSGYLAQINLAYKWQFNKRLNSIGLIEQLTALPRQVIASRALPKISWAFQYELQKALYIHLNVSNTPYGKLIFGGHLLIKALDRQWLFGLSDNLQQCGFAYQAKLKKTVHWGLGLLYHWQLGLSNSIQISHAF